VRGGKDDTAACLSRIIKRRQARFSLDFNAGSRGPARHSKGGVIIIRERSFGKALIHGQESFEETDASTQSKEDIKAETKAHQA
jgi:hypothetical protein